MALTMLMNTSDAQFRAALKHQLQMHVKQGGSGVYGLLIDEIHLEPRVEFTSQHMLALAADGKPPSQGQAMLLTDVLYPTDVKVKRPKPIIAAVQPCNNQTPELLAQRLFDALEAVHACVSDPETQGVCTLIIDNFSTNGKAMKLLVDLFTATYGSRGGDKGGHAHQDCSTWPLAVLDYGGHHPRPQASLGGVHQPGLRFPQHRRVRWRCEEEGLPQSGGGHLEVRKGRWPKPSTPSVI